MRAHRVVVDSEALQHHLGFPEGVEDLAVQEFVPDPRDDINCCIAGLSRRVERLEGEMEALIAGTPELAARKALIASVPGAGPQLVAALIAYLPELGTLDNKRIAALAGVAPFNRDSGGYSGQKRVWGGRGRVRSSLYMAPLWWRLATIP